MSRRIVLDWHLAHVEEKETVHCVAVHCDVNLAMVRCVVVTLL